MQSTFEKRRRIFLDELGPNRMAIVCGSSPSLSDKLSTHPEDQGSNLLYLTGLSEPRAIALFTPQRPQSFTLFVPERNLGAERYTGPQKGILEAQTEYGAHAAFPIEEFEQHLSPLLQGYHEVMTDIGSYPSIESIILRTIAKIANQERRGGKAPSCIRDLRTLLHEQRMHKDEHGMEQLRKAMTITKEAFFASMQATHAHEMTENSIACMIDYTFRRMGGSPGYSTIVATGTNGNILHHTPGTSPLLPNQLLLIDAGCRWNGFTTDVTRTFPIRSGPSESVSFSKEQREIYQLVLSAQTKGIANAVVDSSLDDIHEAILQVLIRGLLDLGLLQGTFSSCLADKSYRRFYPHLSSHWLGMDVHDVGIYYPKGSPRRLQDGMVFTIEPGIYIPEDDDIPERYRGICVRIEDDVLISSLSPNGHEILSAEIPKTIEDIERLLNGLAVP